MKSSYLKYMSITLLTSLPLASSDIAPENSAQQELQRTAEPIPQRQQARVLSAVTITPSGPVTTNPYAHL